MGPHGRRRGVIATLLAAVVFAAPTATVERAGIKAPVPTGWHVIDKRLTPCSNPLERLTLAGPGGGMVMLQESLDPRRYIARFDRRPRRWRLRGKPQPIACCAPSRRAGWFMNFRDSGRGFFVYVYGRTSRARQQALGILDAVEISSRRA
jgi:hypothetical protein